MTRTPPQTLSTPHRFPRSLARPPMGPLAALMLAALLAGCSLIQPAPPVVTYDLGPYVGAPATAARLPKLRVGQIEGPDWLDGTALLYRLQYTQAERLQPYATQRWITSPLRLIDDRLRDAVAARGSLAARGDPGVATLSLDVLDFEQVFESASMSRGVVRVRATVYRGTVIGQKTFFVEQPAATADGAGGVKALASATDAAVVAVLDWVATLPLQ